MNWNLLAFTALMVFLILGALVMLYFQWVDGYVRKWRCEKEIEKSSTTNGQPTVTWVLEAKFKELTDDEIIQLQAEYGIDSSLTCHSVKDFVEAILRKAQGK